jgi:hypothetical protein
MKKIIHIALLCLTTIVFSQEEKLDTKATTFAKLTFGRYGADCSGRGTCSFNTQATKAQANTKLIYNKNESLTLIIDRTKITLEDEIKIVGKQLTKNSKVNDFLFVMEDDFILDTTQQSNLKLPNDLSYIPKGNYPIQITNDTYIITIKLK